MVSSTEQVSVLCSRTEQQIFAARDSREPQFDRRVHSDRATFRGSEQVDERSQDLSSWRRAGLRCLVMIDSSAGRRVLVSWCRERSGPFVDEFFPSHSRLSAFDIDTFIP